MTKSGHYRSLNTRHASHDLNQEWNHYCANAMGVEFVDGHTTSQEQQPTFSVVNLMPVKPTKRKPQESSTSDPWLQSATQISLGLDRMSRFIVTNRQAYASIDFLDTGIMSEEERSVLESTVLSFSATTANQIESLRRQESHDVHDNAEAHRAGIVACLMQRLRQEVADPMAKLQKERNKQVAVAIMKEPLRCELVSPTRGINELDQLMDGPLEEKKFMPRTTKRPRIELDPSYSQDVIDVPPRPRSRLIEMHNEAKELSVERPKQKLSVRFEQNAEPKPVVPLPLAQDHQEQLEQESALLQAEVLSDLDSVVKVEQAMTQITSLLTQFSNLIAEQQEEIMAIHEDTVRSKENVTKGQDSLLEAKRRSRQSKHWMARFIVLLGCILLFFNWIT